MIIIESLLQIYGKKSEISRQITKSPTVILPFIIPFEHNTIAVDKAVLNMTL